mmetsp:Transcript_49536/g.140310  ORF Transcript_49536/g.140310 Transcript_49536/m.140310 type:complete len:228 (+) Transcript_49536:232-915(+)
MAALATTIDGPTLLAEATEASQFRKDNVNADEIFMLLAKIDLKDCGRLLGACRDAQGDKSIYSVECLRWPPFDTTSSLAQTTGIAMADAAKIKREVGGGAFPGEIYVSEYPGNDFSGHWMRVTADNSSMYETCWNSLPASVRADPESRRYYIKVKDWYGNPVTNQGDGTLMYSTPYGTSGRQWNMRKEGSDEPSHVATMRAPGGMPPTSREAWGGGDILHLKYKTEG